MQLLPKVGFKPTTGWSQVQRSTRCATRSTKLTTRIELHVKTAEWFHTRGFDVDGLRWSTNGDE